MSPVSLYQIILNQRNRGTVRFPMQAMKLGLEQAWNEYMRSNRPARLEILYVGPLTPGQRPMVLFSGSVGADRATMPMEEAR